MEAQEEAYLKRNPFVNPKVFNIAIVSIRVCVSFTIPGVHFYRHMKSEEKRNEKRNPALSSSGVRWLTISDL